MNFLWDYDEDPCYLCGSRDDLFVCPGCGEHVCLNCAFLRLCDRCDDTSEEDV